MSKKTKIPEAEFITMLQRILEEIKTQRKFNGNDNDLVSLDEVLSKVGERIGNNWEIVHGDNKKEN